MEAREERPPGFCLQGSSASEQPATENEAFKVDGFFFLKPISHYFYVSSFLYWPQSWAFILKILDCSTCSVLWSHDPFSWQGRKYRPLSLNNLSLLLCITFYLTLLMPFHAPSLERLDTRILKSDSPGDTTERDWVLIHPAEIHQVWKMERCLFLPQSGFHLMASVPPPFLCFLIYLLYVCLIFLKGFKEPPQIGLVRYLLELHGTYYQPGPVKQHNHDYYQFTFI